MIQEHAKKYLALGWSVFPVKPQQKTPAGAWAQYQSQRLKPEAVDEVFKQQSNIAVACGAVSNLLVVDLDIYKGKPGVEGIVSPLMATTPRGGLHLYFKYTPKTQNTVNDELGVDIRSDGGYVVIPPSVITYEKDGKQLQGQYQWVTEPTPDIIDTLPEAPESLLRLVYAKNDPAPILPLETPQIPELAQSWPVSTEGSRNSTLSVYALSLMNRYNGDAKTVMRVLEHRNKFFSPPLPHYEVNTVLQSAAKKYAETLNSFKPARQIHSDLLKQVTVNNEYVHQSLTSDVDHTILQLAQGKKRGYNTGYLELDNLTGGFIPGQSYLIYADTNVGKSVFSLNILVSLAKRNIKCLYFDLENDTALSTERLMMVTNGGKVNLHQYREQLASDPVDIDYLKSIFAPVVSLEKHLDVWSMTKMLERFGEINWAGIKLVIDEKVKEGVQVVVIDHLHYFSPAETDHAVLGEIARQINNYAAEHNLAIVCVAHTKKGLVEVNKSKKQTDGEGVRTIRPTIDDISGSAMIAKHFKNLIAIQRNYAAESTSIKNRTQVYVDKTKYGPSGSFELDFEAMTLIFSPWNSTKYIDEIKVRALDDMMEEDIEIPPELLITAPPLVNVPEKPTVTEEPEYVPPKVPSRAPDPIENVATSDDLADIPF